MAQVTFVNLLSPEYAKYIETSNTAFTQENRGGGYFVDKTMADNLVLLAKKTNTTLIVNSAYRIPGMYVNTSSGLEKTGSSHGIGQAVDILSYKTAGESTSTALANAEVRKYNLGATVSTDSELKNRLSFGAAIYKSKDGSNMGTAVGTSLTDKQYITMKDIWLRETMHFENKSNSADMSKLTTEQMAYMAAALEAQSKYRAAGDFTYFDKEKNSILKKENADLRVREFTIDLDNNSIVESKYMDRAGMAVKSGKLAGDSSPANYDPTPMIDPSVKKQIELARKSSPNNTTSSAVPGGDPFTNAYGASDGKQGSMGDFMTFQGTPVKIPSRAADGTIPRVVEIDSRQFNNGIDNYRDAAQIKKITNKLVKNAMPGKHPFGAQLKHDGAPAAIKLVLDDVFKDKRTADAKKAWEKITQSGIDYIDNFILSRMSEVNSERYQILQSITDDYKIYFSGKSPVVTSIGGHMLNTYNQQWWYDFEYFYDNYLRGSKAVENKIRAFLTIADTIYDILILKFGVQLDANFDDSVMFSIDFVTLQKLHVGEYQTPDQRGADKNNAPKAANMSSNQTEYDDETRQLIENMTLDSESAGARGYQGTTAKNGAVDTQDLEFSLGGKGAIDSSKYNLNNIKTFNSDGSVSQEARNTKSARDDLKNTTYADLQRQIRMGKNGFNSGTPLDNINSAANTNSREKNLSPTVNRNTGTEPFSKGSSGTGSRYDNTRRLTDAELGAAWERTASGVGTAEQQGRDLINKGKADLRDLNNQLKQPLSEFTNNFKGENKPKDAAGAIRAFGNASKSIPKLVEILGYNAGRKGQGYEEDFKNINGTIKQITRDGGAALNETGKRTEEAWKSSFEAGRRQAAADRAGRKK